ncbi:MAG: hypothetical protein H0X01_11000 [Nitrospira sp.]|nr:hypothetical protein [Nitrospira sp.]
MESRILGKHRAMPAKFEAGYIADRTIPTSSMIQEVWTATVDAPAEFIVPTITDTKRNTSAQ